MIEDKHVQKFMVAEIADYNYFNNKHKIIRVKFGQTDEDAKFYDLYLVEGDKNPNPNDHYALVLAKEGLTEGLENVILPGDEKLELEPGYKTDDSLVDEMPWGFVWLIDKHIKNNTTNYNDSSTGMFNQESELPADMNNVKYSLSPSLKEDYTTTRITGDINDKNIGVFVTDNSVFLKSEGGSILLGPQGISILGEKFESNTKGGRGIMQDNPFSGWIPASIMTAPLAIEMIPNFNFIISMGTAGRILNKGLKSIDMATTNIRNITT